MIRNWIKNQLSRRREKRAGFLLDEVGFRPGMSVLDIGCGTDGRSLENFLPDDTSVVGIDLEDPKDVTIEHPGFRYIKRDARDLSDFEDKAFDVAFSIGMMEHVCDAEALKDMASEMNRVAKRLAIVVPWRYAWLEPHFKFPFFQLFPYRVQLGLIRTLDLHGIGDIVTRDPEYIRQHYQWLPSREWQRIFQADKVFLAPTLETITLVKY